MKGSSVTVNHQISFISGTRPTRDHVAGDVLVRNLYNCAPERSVSMYASYIWSEEETVVQIRLLRISAISHLTLDCLVKQVATKPTVICKPVFVLVVSVHWMNS